MTRVSFQTSPSLLSATLARCVDQSANIAPVGVAEFTRRLAAGSEEAFREFHAQYFDRPYLFLLTVTRGQESEAQKALQETLLRVARYVRVFGDEQTFWCWLKAVARSAAQDGGRKHRRYLSLLENFALHRPSGASDTISQEISFHGLLSECLSELEPVDRRLVEGKYLHGSTVKELAEQDGLTEKAVESRLGRLRRNLRERILAKLSEP